MTDDLQIHLVELPKSTATIHNLNQVSSLERWAWFLQHSHTLESATLRRLLPEPAFQEAVGVREMISRDPDQKRLYDARLKFQRDEEARLEYARLEGEKIGQQRGEKLGKIRLLQELLGQPQSGPDELTSLDSTELQFKVEDLQRQLREQGVT